MQTLNDVQTLMRSIIDDAVADAPAAAGGRRRDCVVMMGDMVIEGHVNDVQTLVMSLIDRRLAGRTSA